MLTVRTFTFLLFSLLFFSTSFCLAQTKTPSTHPFYLGAIGGYGSTTWQGLVASKKNQNLALMLSTPVDVEEGGSTWGFVAGYEFTPHFALEADYMHFFDAKVSFNTMSIFSFDNDGLDNLSTQTETVSLMGKIMFFLPQTNLRIFSSAGVADVHRKDLVINNWRLSPTFGVGMNYTLTEHLMGELVGNYTAGFGESQLSPVDTFFPFLYSISVHLIYKV